MEQLKLSVPKKIGKRTYNFAVEGENLFEVVLNSKKLSFGDIANCGLCQSDDLELSAHVAGAKKHKYVCIKCNKCRASLNFGQQQEDSDIFYLRTREENNKKVLDWKAYVAEERQ